MAERAASNDQSVRCSIVLVTRPPDTLGTQ